MIYTTSSSDTHYNNNDDDDDDGETLTSFAESTFGFVASTSSGTASTNTDTSSTLPPSALRNQPHHHLTHNATITATTSTQGRARLIHGSQDSKKSVSGRFFESSGQHPRHSPHVKFHDSINAKTGMDDADMDDIINEISSSTGASSKKSNHKQSSSKERSSKKPHSSSRSGSKERSPSFKSVSPQLDTMQEQQSHEIDDESCSSRQHSPTSKSTTSEIPLSHQKTSSRHEIMKKEQNQKQREQETERKLDLLLKNDYTNDGNEAKKKKSSFNLRKKEKDKVPLLEDSSYFTSLQESDVLPTHKSASVSSNSKYIKARSRNKFKLFRLENKHKKIIVVASFVIAMCFHGQLANYWNTTTFYFDLGLTEQHQKEERSNDENTKNNNDNKNANGDNNDLQTTTLLGRGNKYNGGANLLRSTERSEGDKFLEDVARNNSFVNFVDSFMSTNGDFANSEHLTKFSEQERVVIQMDPPNLYGLKDNWEPIDPAFEIPILWHIPKNGGTTIKDIAGGCHGKIVACEIGVKYGHIDDIELKVLQLQKQRYVNVDTTTIDGLARAKRMRLVRLDDMVDLIVSPYLHEVDNLFGPPFIEGQNRGRVVAMFRHPIERAVSAFNYLQIAHWEPTYIPEMQEWSIEQYATSDAIEDNWITRQLIHDLDSAIPLNMGHLKLAMDVLRRKVFVGLVSRFEESVDRFETLFQWRYTFNPTEQEACRESMLALGSNVAPRGRGNAVPPPGTDAYNLLLSRNKFDMQLYKYVEALFEEQTRLLAGISMPGGFRFYEASCSKCDEKIAQEQYHHHQLQQQR